jgi:hypothetical protein
MEQAAANVANARSGERLSWEKAMEELKAQHKKEKFRIQIHAQDEHDIMNNKIIQLESEIKKQEERYDRAHQILEADCFHEIEGLKAALSKTRFESVLEIQKLTKEKNSLSSQLASEKEERLLLSHGKDDLEQQIDLLKDKHQSVIETLIKNHRAEKSEMLRVHVELFRQHEAKSSKEKDSIAKQLKYVQLEKENIVNESKRKGVRVKSCAASVSQAMHEARQLFRELKSLKHQLNDTKEHWAQCDDKVSTKLHDMRQTCIAIVNQEKMLAESSHAETLAKLTDSCNAKIAAATKETEDAKQMLFQSIREYETKLEREIRHLKDEHSLKVSSLASESKTKCDDLSSKFKDLYKEFEAVVATGSLQQDKLSDKEKCIRQLEMKIIDLTKMHDDEMRSVRSQHQSEKASLMRDMFSKEAMMEEQFTKERTRLQVAVDDLSRKYDEAKQQWELTVSNDTKNEEQIQSL